MSHGSKVIIRNGLLSSQQAQFRIELVKFGKFNEKGRINDSGEIEIINIIEKMINIDNNFLANIDGFWSD